MGNEETPIIEEALITNEDTVTTTDSSAENDKDGGEPIDHTARNGLITAIGVLLGFALTYLYQWSFKSGEWVNASYPTLISLFLGIVLITGSLAQLIIPYQPTIAQYKRAVKTFIFGIAIVFTGVFISIFMTLPFMQ